MSTNNRSAVVLAALAAALAVAALTAAPAGATRTVKISSTLQISPHRQQRRCQGGKPKL